MTPGLHPRLSSLLSRLGDLRAREDRVALGQGLARAATLLSGVLLLGLGSEALLHLDVPARTVLVSIMLLAALGILGAFVGPPLLRSLGLLARRSHEDMAARVGSHFPDLKDRLLNALQLARALERESDPSFSPALALASFTQVATQFEALNLDPVVPREPLRKARRLAFLALTLLGACVLVFPAGLSDAATRLLHFRTDFAPPAPFEFDVKPGDTQVVKGERVVLSAKTSGLVERTVRFHIREEGQENFDPLAARRDSTGRWAVTFEGVRTSFTYYAEADGYRSRHYRVDVVDRPFVRNLRVQVQSPAYARQPIRTLDDNVGDVTALRGSIVSFELALSKEVRSARMVYADSQAVALTVEGTRARGSLRLVKDRAYHIELTDREGLTNPNPVTYSLRVIEDLPPTIQLLEPASSATLDERMRVALLTRIGDDFGFSKLVLHYRLAASKFEKPQEAWSSLPIPLPSPQRAEMDVPFTWNLASLQLVPEDVVSFYVEVFDNDAVSGPKSARSAILNLRLPSLEEVFSQADKTQNQAIGDLQKAGEDAGEVKKALDQLQRELRQQNKETVDWQQKKQFQEALRKQEELLKKVDEVNRSLDELNKDLQRQNALSPETMQKYDELQKLLKELNNPQFQNLLKKLNEQAPTMTPEQMKQAVQDMKMNEEMFREGIERTIELLKRLQIEQKVDELEKRAGELAKAQEDLAERTKNAESKDQKERDRLAKEQRELSEQAKAMQREMDQLNQQMQEFPQDMPLGEMQEAQQEMNLSQMQQEMSESASQCEGGNCQSASAMQKKTAERMRSVQKKMQAMKKKMSQEMKKQVERAFRKALDNLLSLSRQQEELKNRTSKLSPNSPQFRESMRQQAELSEQLQGAASDLMEMGKKSFAITPQMAQKFGDAFNRMNEALQSMQNRDARSSGERMGGAMQALNEAAREIAQGMQKSSGSKSGSSMMQQLQQMAQQQQNLNAQTQQIGQGQGQGRMTQQQMAAMQRLAQEQRGMQKSLEELDREARSSTEGQKMLGDLRKIAEEMQEVVRDLQQGEVNPETLQRQERILSRLLDASKSMRERDWEKKRRAETANEVSKRSPGELDPSLLDPRQGIQRDLQRAVQEGYRRDYEALIRSYYENVQKTVGTR